MGYDMLYSLVTDYSLFCCDCDFDISNNISYTYKHDTLQEFSWLDHIFITDRLCQDMSNFHICDSGANLSDHIPISCSLAVKSDKLRSMHKHSKR